MVRKVIIGLVIGLGVTSLSLLSSIIQKEKVVKAQSQAASNIKRDVDAIEDMFREICRGRKEIIDDELIKDLGNIYNMKGWGDFGRNWYKYEKGPFSVEIRGATAESLRREYKFKNEEAKKKFCEENFDKWLMVKNTSTLGFLNRQADLYYLLEKFEIFGQRIVDSFRGRANRLQNFDRLVLNKLKTTQKTLTFYITPPVKPQRWSNVNIKMLTAPNANMGLDKKWVDEFRSELGKLSYMQKDRLTYIASTSNATITVSYQNRYYELKMEFKNVGNPDAMSSSLRNLVKNLLRLLRYKESLQKLWEDTNPDNAQINVPRMEYIKQDADNVERNYDQLEHEILNYIIALITGQTLGGRSIDDVSEEVVKHASSTTEAAEKYGDALIDFTPAEIKVEPVEQPIAVLPPVVFSGEHRGTPTFAQITPETIFNEIRDFLFKLAPTIFILLLVIGAIFYLISPINLQHIQTGSEYIKWAIVGYFLLLVVTGIISAVRVIFGGP